MFIDPRSPDSPWHRVLGTQGDVARRVLDVLLTDGPTARTRLADRLGVTTSSVTKAVRTLTTEGLAEIGPAVVSGTVGRPLQPVSARAGELNVIGCKVVPGWVLGCRANLMGDVLARGETRIPATTAQWIATGCLEMARRLDADRPVVGLGLGVGGTIARDRRTLVLSSALEATPGQDLVADIERELGIPVHLENDLRSLVEMERRIGVGRHVGSFIMVTLGEGVGACIVDHGHAVTGATGEAGLSQWMTTLDEDGRLQPGGRLLNTLSILEQCAARDLPADLDALIRSAESGDPQALEVADWVVARLVPLLASLVSFTDPQLILLGGELSPLLTPVTDHLAARMAGLVAPLQRTIPIHIADWELGDWARGAAVIAVEELLRV